MELFMRKGCLHLTLKWFDKKIMCVLVPRTMIQETLFFFEVSAEL